METANARQIFKGLSSPFQANLSQIRVPLVQKHQMLKAVHWAQLGNIFFSSCCCCSSSSYTEARGVKSSKIENTWGSNPNETHGSSPLWAASGMIMRWTAPVLAWWSTRIVASISVSSVSYFLWRDWRLQCCSVLLFTKKTKQKNTSAILPVEINSCGTTFINIYQEEWFVG